MTATAKGVFLHGNGWASSSELRLKNTVRGSNRVYFVEAVAPFHIGERWEKETEVDALIITDKGERQYYTGLVEGMARSGLTKILLTSKASTDKDKINEIYIKIGEYNHGRRSIAR